ncbi:MAG: OmpA family protein [Alphaproteobacteria bacterium]|nr:OmpA family protein [Alphaproteobacteria bacterium]
MRSFLRSVCFVSILGLAGCGTFSAEPFLSKVIKGDNFEAHLAKFYQEETKVASQEENWALAALYAEKGRLAVLGNTPEPWTAEYFDNNHNYVTNNDDNARIALISDARGKLMDTLVGNRDLRPEECARAQVMFDRHMVDEAFTRPDMDGAKHQAIFEEALLACGAPAIPAISQFTIYFGFDRSELTAEAQQVIKNVASVNAGDSVNVYGHADTAGPAAYNDRLSERRAVAVANALRKAGVRVVAVIPEGERDLAEPTPDNVPNPRNRRAVIEFR